MIDTIHMRLHGLKDHAALAEHIEKIDRGTAYWEAKVAQREVQTWLKFHVVEFRDSNKIRFRFKDDFIEPSSHYKVLMIKDREGDFVDFQFSVPKYLYGSNIVQFVQHFDEYSQPFSIDGQSRWAVNAAQAHERLFKFIRMFFAHNWPGVRVNFRMVELLRVDLCFNQIFYDKREAFDYLEMMKRVRKRYAREVSRKWDRHETGIFWATPDSSFKIYHKGTEYQQHDRKEHENINDRVGHKLYDVRKYQEVADRILRYEMTFRKGAMSRMFRERLFRKDCPTWQRRRKVHAIMQAKHGKAERTAKAKLKMGRYDFNDWMKEPKDHRVIWRETERLLGQSAEFYLEISDEDHEYNTRWPLHVVAPLGDKAMLRKPAKFTVGLMRLMANTFRENCMHFQVKETTPLSRLGQRIKAYNEKARKAKDVGLGGKEVKEGPLRVYLALMNEYSADEIVRLGFKSKSQVNRILQTLKRMGIEGKQHHGGRAIEATMDFRRYHEVVMSVTQLRHGHVMFR